MRKVGSLILILLFIYPLFAISVVPTDSFPQTFDSVENLAKFDFASSLYSADAEFYEKVKISLITVDPGSEVYVWFGHTALEIELPEQIPLMVDYGVFSFGDDFYLNFAMGRLYYIMHMSSSSSQYRGWTVYEDRGVEKVELDLTPAAKKGILDFIQYNSLNYTYLYHHYEDNCATRVRDIINAASGDEFKTWAENKAYSSTYRDLSSMYMRQNFIVNFALNFIQSGQIDAPISYYDAFFLPDILDEGVKEFFNESGSVVHVSETRVKNPTKSNLTFEAFDIGLILALLFLLLFNRKKAWIRSIGYILYIILNIVLVLMSLVLLFMMLFTNHSFTYYNENIIFINPLLLIGVFSAFSALFRRKYVSSAFKKFNRFYAILIIILLIFKGIFPSVFLQANLAYILFCLPMHIVLGFFVKQREEE